uniref:UDP-glucuronosyltransferase n=2 Tax=Parascaris univalens TaxID=6257 RepID=A0A915BJV5_PARUN
MRFISPLIVLIWIAVISNAYKIAVFVPAMISSQLIWNVRVAEELTKAGHRVTLIRLKTVNVTLNEPRIMDGIEQWYVDAVAIDYAEMQSRQSKLIYRDYSIFEREVRETFSAMLSAFVRSCELTLLNTEFMERLKAAQFDIAFSHMYHFCPIGLIRAANIPAWIWLNSGQLMDLVAEYVGIPSPPSYVPLMLADSSDEMSFIQRLKTLIGRTLLPLTAEKALIAHESELFRKYVDPSFPDLIELAKLCPLVMVNSNELYNLPRPILHKIIYIGGLGMKHKNAKPLTGEVKEIVDRAKRIALMTFGSHANSTLMPQSWKQAFLNSFRTFPDIEFIIRYEGKDLDGKTPNNVHLKPWIPQSDLLQNEKTALLITHAGYNSLQEAIISGVPIITIALFGDQPGNAKLAVKHGFGYNIRKGEVTTEMVTKALDVVLHNSSYKESAVRMRNMVLKKPSQPEELLVRWTEFVAEFKQLPNLVPYSVRLNFIQYHCLDVIALLSIITIVALIILIQILKLTFRFICRKITAGKEKLKAQ